MFRLCRAALLAAIAFSIQVLVFDDRGGAQGPPIQIGPKPTGITIPVPSPRERLDHCKPYDASSENMPRWSEVVAKNVGDQGGLTVVGVPNLKKPMSMLAVPIKSVRNVFSAITNISLSAANPSQILSKASGDGAGVGLCKLTAPPAGTTQFRVKTNVKYCGYRASGFCGTDATAFIWLPYGVDVGHKLMSVAGNEITFEKLAGYANDQIITINGTVNQAEPKTVLKLMELYETINDFDASTVTMLLSFIQTKAGKYKDWLDKLLTGSNKFDQFLEGYHLGAYDDLRPDLHYCVGYYGHKTQLNFLSLFDGKIAMGSSYGSDNISKGMRAQFRSGGLTFSAFNKPYQLLPGVEVNAQVPGLEPWNCHAPFGLNMNLCANATYNVPVDACTASSNPGTNAGSTAYLSNQNLTNGGGYTSGNYDFKGLPDYYKVNFANGSVLEQKWPKDISIGNMSVQSGLPSYAVMSAGTNFGKDFGLKDSPRILKTIPVFAGMTAVLKWNVNYGFNFLHEANFILQRVKDAMVASNMTTAAVAAVWKRDMHAMQADDLTADNGNGFYVNPSLLLNFGYQYWNKKQTLGLQLTLDFGLHADVEPNFYAGVADANIALRQALAATLGTGGQDCKPIVEEDKSESMVSCTSDGFLSNNTQLANALGKIANKDYSSLHSADLFYSCKSGTAAQAKAAHVDLASTGVTVRKCEEWGRCHVPRSGTTIDNVSPSDCKSKEGNYTPYSCRTIKETKITGWKGESCSPLLTGGAFPTAPGGACTRRSPPPGLTPEVTYIGACVNNTFSCVEGACLKRCTADSDCGSTSQKCDAAKRVCVRKDGQPFLEQTLWHIANPQPDKPIHAVWSYAANSLQAKLDATLGGSAKIRIKFWKIDKEWVKSFDKLFPLFQDGMFKYAPGLSAEYNSSCKTGVGSTVLHQAANLSRMTSDGLSSPMTSHEFAKQCRQKMPNGFLEDVADTILPTADRLANSANDLFNFAENFATDIWNSYNGQVCVNGMQWNQWLWTMGQITNVDYGHNALYSLITIDGQPLDPANPARHIAKKSGCLKPSSSVPGSAAMANLLGLNGDGDIKVYENLIDPAGDVEDSNLPSLVTSKLYWPIWRAQVQACMSTYIDQKLAMADLQLSKCDHAHPAGKLPVVKAK